MRSVVWFLMLGGVAYAQTDRPTVEWFKSLSSPFTRACCSESDCKKAESNYHDGAWWAKSNRTGEWVRIHPQQYTTQDSVFAQAVLCETEPVWTNSGYVPHVLCFSRPPAGI